MKTIFAYTQGGKWPEYINISTVDDKVRVTVRERGYSHDGYDYSGHTSYIDLDTSTYNSLARSLNDTIDAGKSTTEDINAKLDVASRHVPRGSRWQHYKGGVYEVTGYAHDTERNSINILYKRIDGPNFNAFNEVYIIHSRPLGQWFDKIGETFRFLKVMQKTVFEWVPVK